MYLCAKFVIITRVGWNQKECFFLNVPFSSRYGQGKGSIQKESSFFCYKLIGICEILFTL